MRIALSDKDRNIIRNNLNLEAFGNVPGKYYWNICSHLRLLYDKIDKGIEKDLQKELCEEILYLAQRMNEQLTDYSTTMSEARNWSDIETWRSKIGYYPKD